MLRFMSGGVHVPSFSFAGLWVKDIGPSEELFGRGRGCKVRTRFKCHLSDLLEVNVEFFMDQNFII